MADRQQVIKEYTLSEDALRIEKINEYRDLVAALEYAQKYHEPTVLFNGRHYKYQAVYEAIKWFVKHYHHQQELSRQNTKEILEKIKQWQEDRKSKEAEKSKTTQEPPTPDQEPPTQTKLKREPTLPSQIAPEPSAGGPDLPESPISPELPPDLIDLPPTTPPRLPTSFRSFIGNIASQPIKTTFSNIGSGLSRASGTALKSLGKNIFQGAVKGALGGLKGFGAMLTRSLILASPYILVGVLLIFAFSFLYQSTQVNPQVVSQLTPVAIGGSIGPGVPLCDPQTDPECAVAFCDPATQNCLWPTPCGCIIQGPYTSGASSTHGSLNAIDITFGNCTPSTNVTVTATHTGTVTHRVDGIVDGTWITGSYGNEIRLTGTDENGKSFTTLYTHLSNGTVTPRNNIDIVEEKLGETDDTGHSHGEHLHYEYQKGSSINEILPVSVPKGCNGFAECGSVCW